MKTVVLRPLGNKTARKIRYDIDTRNKTDTQRGVSFRAWALRQDIPFFDWVRIVPRTRFICLVKLTVSQHISSKK